MTSLYKFFVYIVLCSENKQFGFNTIDLAGLVQANYQSFSYR